MNRYAFLPGLLLLPLACNASGHSPGLENLDIVFYIFGFAAFTVILNLVSIIAGGSSNGSFAYNVVWLTVLIDIAWLLYCGRIEYNRYDEHRDYLRYGPEMDREGFASFNGKFMMIAGMVVTATFLNIMVLRKIMSERKRLPGANNEGKAEMMDDENTPT